MRKGLVVWAVAAAVAAAPAASVAQVVLQPAAPTPQAAPAQAAPAQAEPQDPDSVLVEELVVVARDRGPAWWTVSNGTSTVYVLGGPSLAPKRLPWDVVTLQRRLVGANVVILPFEDVKVKLGGSLGTAISYMRLRMAGPFENSLDPATRARFVAAREKIGQPANRYKSSNALAAGLLLAGDYRDKSGLTNADTAKVVKHYAALGKVPVIQKSYDVSPLLSRVLSTPKAAARACLDVVMEQVEAGPGVTIAAAKAWAEGNTIGALENERTYERCVNLVPGAQVFDAKTKADQIAAIEKALTKPGHAIAVVHLRPLLAQGGVLDQLRAKGYVVKTPAQIAEEEAAKVAGN